MRMTIVLIAFLLASVLLHPYITVAQSTTEPSVCEYQETRNPVPINPKTNKPYTPDERNQEPFDPDLSRPLDVKTLVTCLFREREIINHHVAFEDLVTAWRAAVLLKAIESLRARGIEKPSEVEIKKAQTWDLPIKLRDGVLHAANGIHLGVFSDPRVNSVDDLEPDMRDALKLNRDAERLHIVRPTIIWRGMTIDAGVGAFRNEGNPLLILDGGIVFDEATFRKAVVFYGVTLSKRRLVSFDKAKFHKRADFHKVTFTFARFNEATFSDEADFHESRLHKVDFENFANGIDFFGATFSKKVSFNRARFDPRVSFRNATFRENADFTQATFTRGSFLGATFDKAADFQFTRFSKQAGFSGVTFGEYAVFFHAKFHDQASFSSATFEKTTFSEATFDKQADFRWTRFKDSASFVKSIFTTVIFDSAYVNVLLDLREAVVSDILVFDKITSKGRIDLRGSQLAAWHWDSSDLPSQVVGIVDARSLRAGNLTLRSVYFQEIVDFSGMVIGLFAAPLEHFTPVFEIISLDFLDPLTNSIEVTDGRAITQIEYVTFAQDVDFLHTTFYGPVRFNRNRFRATLDFTGSTFATDTAYFCFAFNRINRLIFESKHLGNIRRINAPECLVATTSKSPPEDINRTAERLPSIYKSLEKAFKDANDRRGVNEAWYLATVAERDQADGKKQTIWEAISAKFSWLLFDIPSRYTVDVWRTVWVSIAIIVCFFILYLLYFQIFDFVMEFWHLVRGEKYQRDVWARTIQIPEPSDRHRAFRFRPFEPIHSIRKFHEREIYPVRDAVSLSIRAFTKLGLGTVYPDSRPLKWLTTIEWALGVFMLIHFILAVKNNLPFILPFLGAVN